MDRGYYSVETVTVRSSLLVAFVCFFNCNRSPTFFFIVVLYSAATLLTQLTIKDTSHRCSDYFDSRVICSVACKSVLSDRHSLLLVIYYLDIHLANIIPEYSNFGERLTFLPLVLTLISFLPATMFFFSILSLSDFSVSVRFCISSIRIMTINCMFLVNCFIISKQEQVQNLSVS